MAKTSSNSWIPEPKYFLQDVVDKNHYEKTYFNNDSKIRGEKSVIYFERPDIIIPNVKKNYQNVNIIVCMRNPSMRALSHYFYTYANGLETRTLEQVFLENMPQPQYDTESISCNPFEYLSRSLYVEGLKSYQNEFNVLPLCLEEFVGNKEIISQIYKFVGADSNYISNIIQKRVNDIKWDDVSIRVLDFLNQYFISQKQELESILHRNLPW